jgi:hypothetical protein
MAQSKFTISSVDYNLNVMSFSDSNEAVITENQTVTNPEDYGADNSVLTANGSKKHRFSITGNCTFAQKTIFVNAMKNQTKVYPFIYPGNGSTNVITTNAYYYIQMIDGRYNYADDVRYWYSIDLIYGGVT